MGENTIFKQHRRSNYTAVPNALLNDRSLSWAETGMMVYLLSLPDGWQVRTDDLVGRKTNGRDLVRALQKSLSEKGYLHIVKYRDKGGLWRRTVHVFDEPCLTFRHGQTGTVEPARFPRPHSKEPVAKTQKSKYSVNDDADVRTNTYEGICALCGGIVPAEEGRLIGKLPRHIDEEACTKSKQPRTSGRTREKPSYVHDPNETEADRSKY